MYQNSEAFEAFLSDLAKNLPDICTSKDLVKVNLFSNALLSNMRQDGNGPPFLKIAKGQIRYLKADVIEWLRTTQKIQSCGKRGRTDETPTNQMRLF